jgi:hypothetical protein
LPAEADVTSVEQHKMVQRLKQVVRKMTADERRGFEMMAKRDRDDEDLDALTREKLARLYEKYFPKHSKAEIGQRWENIMGKKPE